VLALAFFASVFSSFMWLIYMFLYLRDKAGSAGFGSLGLADTAIYTALLLLPVFMLWIIFGHISQYSSSKNVNGNMQKLFQQMKKNQDYTDLVARVLLELEQELKDGFILNKFELFISDMNELLAETIQRGALASPDQIDRLWTKVRNGGKWAFGKVIIEISANQSNFGNRLISKAGTDKILAGTIFEFCARYQNLLAILEKHDKEKIFLAVIETGVYGKVYSILAPLTGQIRKVKEQEKENFKVAADDDTIGQKPFSATAEKAHFYKDTDEPRKSFIEVFNPFKRRQAMTQEEPQFSTEPDPFSAALERSFGTAAEEPQAPRLSAAPLEEESISMPTPGTISTAPSNLSTGDDVGFTHTQKALHNLKKEWEEIKEIHEETAVSLFERKEPTVSSRTSDKTKKETNDQDYAYPFSGWTDVDKYNQ